MPKNQEIKIEEFAGLTEVLVAETQITIFHPDKTFGKPSGAKINWPAIGSVSPEDAENFARGLLKAAELARQMNQKAVSK